MAGIVADGLNSRPHAYVRRFSALPADLVFCRCADAGLLLKFWLTSRQIRHVATTRQRARTLCRAHHAGSPPEGGRLHHHQGTLGLLEMALGAAVLLGWTLLGGLDALNQALLAWLGGGMVQQLALLAAFVLISGLIDLPVTLYQTFVIEQRFGFNKMTLAPVAGDLAKSTLVGALIGLPIAALILWLMGAAGSTWWLWAWGCGWRSTCCCW
jgi:STE24 endopeptidase